MPSESVAREMLKDVLLGTDNKDNLIIVTTFSSHIARLKSIIEFGQKLNRKIIFLGRSLAKYVKAAENIGIVDFSKDVEIVKYGRQIERMLKKVDKDREKYLLIVTGHQGEPKSVLYKIAKGEFEFDLYPEDSVVFSCRTIPTPTNIENRDALENELKQTGVRIFKDIHQSGHAAREDLRDFINLVKPKNIIPAHGTKEMRDALAELCTEMGYKTGKNIFLIKDGQKIEL
jgi:ribonuclease J